MPHISEQQWDAGLSLVRVAAGAQFALEMQIASQQPLSVEDCKRLRDELVGALDQVTGGTG